MNKLVPCAWLLSGALEVWSLRLRVGCDRGKAGRDLEKDGVWKEQGGRGRVRELVMWGSCSGRGGWGAGGKWKRSDMGKDWEGHRRERLRRWEGYGYERID